MGRKKKLEIEKIFEQDVEEIECIELKEFTIEHYLTAITDLASEVKNAYFRVPYTKCKSCDEDNTKMVYFGDGSPDKIGNLVWLKVGAGDIISWRSRYYTGMSVVKSKLNGVITIEQELFQTFRKEPTIMEKVLIPSKYAELINEMASYLANSDIERCDKVSKIGNSEYPNAFKKKL